MSYRVLIAHNDYQLSGGEGNVADYEARMLTKHGNYVLPYRRNNSEIAGYGALQKLRLALATFFSWRTYREVRALIRENQINVVHVHNTVPLISPSIYYAAWAEHVTVVQTVHNYRFLCPNGMFYRDGHICEDCLKKGLFCAVRHACYRHSRAQSMVLAGTIGLHRLLGTYRRMDAYIALTTFAKEKLCAIAPSERIYVKQNIVSVSQTLVPYDMHGHTYVFLGRLDAEKGVWILLKAFEKMPDLSLTIIGNGPEEANMRAYIERHCMQNVTMTGVLPHEAATGLLAKACAFVMPTQWYEGLPLTVLEAFVLGTPVVGSRMGNVGAILQNYGGGIAFDQTDPEALITCIRSFTPEKRAIAAAQALEAAKRLCDEEENYRMLCGVYEAARNTNGYHDDEKQTKDGV